MTQEQTTSPALLARKGTEAVMSQQLGYGADLYERAAAGFREAGNEAEAATYQDMARAVRTRIACRMQRRRPRALNEASKGECA